MQLLYPKATQHVFYEHFRYLLRSQRYQKSLENKQFKNIFKNMASAKSNLQIAVFNIGQIILQS